jgi:hypothetical protein
MAEMTPLLEQHVKDIRFSLRVKHKHTGLYISERGLSKHYKDALIFSADYKGAAIDEIFEAFMQRAAMDFLLKIADDEVEIESKLEQ